MPRDTNKLKAGITKEAVLDAVVRSGFPLQTIIGSRLVRRGYVLEEEWAYFDRDADLTRTLDLQARRVLWDEFRETAAGDLGALLSLLIECKQSELPYVFFEAVSPPCADRFPPIAGLPHREISVNPVPKENRFWRIPVQEVLGLPREKLIATPPVASSLSRVTRAGQRLDLSGEEPYRALVLPLTKAVDHYRDYWKPPNRSGPWVARLTLAVAVLDAPMMLARTPREAPTIEPVPWVRVIRHRAEAERDVWRAPEVAMINVVHKSFFDSFVTDYLNPLARTFKQRLDAHQQTILSGDGYIRMRPDEEVPEKNLHRRVRSEP